jgi:hypothetical protein
MALSVYNMVYHSAGSAVVPCKVQCRQSALNSDVPVVDIKPVDRVTTASRSVVPTVCLKEQVSCQIWAAHSYRFVARQVNTDIFELPVTYIAPVHYPLGTASPIYRTGTSLPSKHPILYLFSRNIRTECFKHAAHSPFFSSKCRLFHNATLFGSSVIHILHTGWR